MSRDEDAEVLLVLKPDKINAKAKIVQSNSILEKLKKVFLKEAEDVKKEINTKNKGNKENQCVCER